MSGCRDRLLNDDLTCYSYAANLSRVSAHSIHPRKSSPGRWYQYLRAGQDVRSQANAFINWIGPNLNEGEIPILDLEEGSGNQSGRANQWFAIIDDAYDLISLPLGQRSWLYSG